MIFNHAVCFGFLWLLAVDDEGWIYFPSGGHEVKVFGSYGETTTHLLQKIEDTGKALKETAGRFGTAEATTISFSFGTMAACW